MRLSLLAALFATLLSPIPSSLAQAPVRPSVVIPNFFDPRERIDRPAAGTVPAIRFLTTDDFPPFNFLGDRAQLTGFNVDLARAICTELMVPCTIQARAFDDLVGHLADKTADAVIAGVAISPEARATVDFSEVYLRLPARFAARKANQGMAVSPGALQGKTVAVAAGSAHEAYLSAMFPEANAKGYPSGDAARAAVKNGEADLVFGDGEQLSFFLQSDGCCVFVGGPYLDTGFFGEGFAIAVAKGASPLKRAINAALQSLYDKGVFADLYLRYFPVGFF